jgi:hypothetical protein
VRAALARHLPDHRAPRRRRSFSCYRGCHPKPGSAPRHDGPAGTSADPDSAILLRLALNGTRAGYSGDTPVAHPEGCLGEVRPVQKVAGRTAKWLESMSKVRAYIRSAAARSRSGWTVWS